MSWPFRIPWWWQYGRRISALEERSTQSEEDIMSLQQDASDLKGFLDAIAADVAPIKNGIDALAANLAAALAGDKPDENLLKSALDEAQSLKSTFDQMANSFASAGSPIPASPNPAPEPVADKPADPPVDGAQSGGEGSGAQSGDGSSSQT